MRVLSIINVANFGNMYNMVYVWPYPTFLTLYRICKTLIMA